MSLSGWATAAGTARYRDRVGPRAAAGHFREAPGRDGVLASSIGLGTYLGADTAEDDACYRAAARRALAAGVNVLDTAVNYRSQRSERAIGRALTDAVADRIVSRDEVVVTTKGGFVGFEGLRHEVDQSRRNLGLDTIDVYYVHNPETQMPIVGRDEFERRLTAAFAALEEAVAEGAIRCYGTATWTGYRRPPEAPDHLSLERVLACARAAGGERHHFRALQLPYNLAMAEALALENQAVGEDRAALLVAATHFGLTVTTSASIGQGGLARRLPPFVAEALPGLATDAQRALQFVRSTPGVTTALVGMKQPSHVAENLALARVPPASQAQLARLLAGGR